MDMEHGGYSLSTAMTWQGFVNRHFVEAVVYLVALAIIGVISLRYSRHRLELRRWLFDLFMAAFAVVLPTFMFFHMTTAGSVFIFFLDHFPPIGYVFALAFMAVTTYLHRIEHLPTFEWTLALLASIFGIIFPTYMLSLE